MIKNILSLAFLLISVALNCKHGWDTLNYKNNPETVKTLADLRISTGVVPWFGMLAVGIGILLIIPRTFFLGNLLNALSIVLIMAFAMRAGNFKMVLLEIPFLAIPLLMIWLKYPFKN